MKTAVTFPEQPLHTRRDVMVKGIAGALAVAGYGSRTGIVLASVPGITNGETPGAEEGPFWVDGQVERVDMRPDSVTAVYPAGLPIYLGLTVSQLSDTAPYTITPLVGAKVDMWNANAQGVYSDEASESTTGTDYQRGYQITDAHGVVNILTNYSGWYSGRTPHIHIRVRTYDSTGTTVTYNYCTQLFFDDAITAVVFASNSAYVRTATRDAYNTTDRVYIGSGTNGSPATEVGDYLQMKLADDSTHAVASFHIVLDLSDTSNVDVTGGTETGNGGGTTGTGGGGTPPTGTGGGGTPPTGGGGGAAPAARTATASTTSSSKSKVKAKAAKSSTTAKASSAKATAAAKSSGKSSKKHKS